MRDGIHPIQDGHSRSRFKMAFLRMNFHESQCHFTKIVRDYLNKDSVNWSWRTTIMVSTTDLCLIVTPFNFFALGFNSKINDVAEFVNLVSGAFKKQRHKCWKVCFKTYLIASRFVDIDGRHAG